MPAKKQTTLQDLFVDQLRDLYDAEHRILQALPKMIKKASASALIEALETHLEETEGQVERLDQVFAMIDETPKRKKCHGIVGLLEEGEEALKEPMTDAVRDAAIIAAGQRVEHYEMAGYGCVRTYAERLGFDEAAELLQQTLDEEGNADKTLTQVAETVVNEEAMDDEE